MTSTKQTTAAEAVIQSLEAAGVEMVFGMPGSHILRVYDALADSSIRYVSAAHEATSAFMAGMVGYLTGRPGVALLTAGPAATNSMTGVVQAYASSLPMVHITADVPLRARREAFHGVDRADFLHRMFADVTKASVRIEDPEQIPSVLARAFELAASDRPGPVHVDIPIDLTARPVSVPRREPPAEPRARVASEAWLARACEGLQKARRPMICAGRGVLVQRASEALQQLAERLGAPVLTTAYGIGAFDQSHPLAVGTWSEFSRNGFAFDRLARSDFLLVVGLRPDTLMTAQLHEAAPPARAFVALESDALDPGSTWSGAVEAADARATLGALLERLGERAPGSAELQEQRAAIVDQQRCFAAGIDDVLDQAADQEPLHFGVVMRALAQRLDPRAIVVSGVGNHHVWARNVLPVRDRTSFIAEAAWGTMGGELGGGIAAKLVHPEREVVTVTGDASLLMFGGELATAVAERANLLVVVLNDGGHGIIGQMQRQMFGRAYADRLPTVDFAALARSQGAVGIRVSTPSELPRALDRALGAARESAVVLDVVCTSDVPWPKRDALVEHGRGVRAGGGR